MYNLFGCIILICLVLNLGFASCFVSGKKRQETRRLRRIKSKSSKFVHHGQAYSPANDGAPSEKKKQTRSRSRIKSESSKLGVRNEPLVPSKDDKPSKKKSVVRQILRHNICKQKHLPGLQIERKSSIHTGGGYTSLELSEADKRRSEVPNQSDLDKHDGERKCNIPFIYDGKTVYNCLDVIGARSRKWCSLTNNYDRDTRWMYCPVDKLVTKNVDRSEHELSDFSTGEKARPEKVKRLPNSIEEIVYTLDKTYDDFSPENGAEIRTLNKSVTNAENSNDMASGDGEFSPVKIQYNGTNNEDEITAFAQEEFNGKTPVNLNTMNADKLLNISRTHWKPQYVAQGGIKGFSGGKSPLDDDDKAMIDYVSNSILRRFKNSTNIGNRTLNEVPVKNVANPSKMSTKVKYKKITRGKKPYIIYKDELERQNSSAKPKRQRKIPSEKNVNIIIINNQNDTIDLNDIETVPGNTESSEKKVGKKHNDDAAPSIANSTGYFNTSFVHMDNNNKPLNGTSRKSENKEEDLNEIRHVVNGTKISYAGKESISPSQQDQREISNLVNTTQSLFGGTTNKNKSDHNQYGIGYAADTTNNFNEGKVSQSKKVQSQNQMNNTGAGDITKDLYGGTPMKSNHKQIQIVYNTASGITNNGNAGTTSKSKSVQDQTGINNAVDTSNNLNGDNNAVGTTNYNLNGAKTTKSNGLQDQNRNSNVENTAKITNAGKTNKPDSEPNQQYEISYAEDTTNNLKGGRTSQSKKMQSQKEINNAAGTSNNMNGNSASNTKNGQYQNGISNDIKTSNKQNAGKNVQDQNGGSNTVNTGKNLSGGKVSKNKSTQDENEISDTAETNNNPDKDKTSQNKSENDHDENNNPLDTTINTNGGHLNKNKGQQGQHGVSIAVNTSSNLRVSEVNKTKSEQDPNEISNALDTPEDLGRVKNSNSETGQDQTESGNVVDNSNNVNGGAASNSKNGQDESKDSNAVETSKTTKQGKQDQNGITSGVDTSNKLNGGKTSKGGSKQNQNSITNEEDTSTNLNGGKTSKNKNRQDQNDITNEVDTSNNLNGGKASKSGNKQDQNEENNVNTGMTSKSNSEQDRNQDNSAIDTSNNVNGDKTNENKSKQDQYGTTDTIDTSNNLNGSKPSKSNSEQDQNQDNNAIDTSNAENEGKSMDTSNAENESKSSESKQGQNGIIYAIDTSNNQSKSNSKGGQGGSTNAVDTSSYPNGGEASTNNSGQYQSDISNASNNQNVGQTSSNKNEQDQSEVSTVEDTTDNLSGGATGTNKNKQDQSGINNAGSTSINLKGGTISDSKVKQDQNLPNTVVDTSDDQSGVKASNNNSGQGQNVISNEVDTTESVNGGISSTAQSGQSDNVPGNAVDTTENISGSMTSKSNSEQDQIGVQTPSNAKLLNPKQGKDSMELDESDVVNGNVSDTSYKDRKHAGHTPMDSVASGTNEMELSEDDMNAINPVNSVSNENNAAMTVNGVNMTKSRNDGNMPAQPFDNKYKTSGEGNNVINTGEEMPYNNKPGRIVMINSGKIQVPQSNKHVDEDKFHTMESKDKNTVYFNASGVPLYQASTNNANTTTDAQHVNDTTPVQFDNTLSNSVMSRIQNVLNTMSPKEKQYNSLASGNNQTASIKNGTKNISRVKQSTNSSLLQSASQAGGFINFNASNARNLTNPVVTKKPNKQNSTLVIDIQVGDEKIPASNKDLKNATTAIQNAIDSINDNKIDDLKLLPKNETKEKLKKYDNSLMYPLNVKTSAPEQLAIERNNTKPSKEKGSNYSFSDLLNDYNGDEPDDEATSLPPSSKKVKKVKDHLNMTYAPLRTSGRVNMSYAPEEVEILTFGGNGNGVKCKFPFIYDGVSYFNCITLGREKPWCSITANYDKVPKWGYCNDKELFGIGRGDISDHSNLIQIPKKKATKPRHSVDTVYGLNNQSNSTINTFGGNANGTRCVIPFVYDGQIHTRCIPRNNNGASWCAVSHSYDVHPMWGYCCIDGIHQCAAKNLHL